VSAVAPVVVAEAGHTQRPRYSGAQLLSQCHLQTHTRKGRHQSAVPTTRSGPSRVGTSLQSPQLGQVPQG